MSFQCRQFYLKDDHCAMKVSTDSLLLGSWAVVHPHEATLDLGCGCGILALMMAQRGAAPVVALELDAAAAAQARTNVAASPWPQVVQVEQAEVVNWCVHHASYAAATEQDDASKLPAQFAHVIFNPPYFAAHLASDDQQRRLARQGQGAVWSDWLQAASHVLTATGRVSFIAPVLAWSAILTAASAVQLQVSRYCEVQATPNKPARLLLIELQRGNQRGLPPPQQLCIRNQTNQYTDEFKQLTGAFYLN